MALITPRQVIELAFNDSEFITSDVISNSDITTAELRYFKPILGYKLYARLRSENRASVLIDEFLAPAIAIATRLITLPMLAAKSGRFGVSVLQTTNQKSATDSELSSIRRSLLLKLRMHQRLLTDYLEDNRELYPEYMSHQNSLKRCSISGGIVQDR